MMLVATGKDDRRDVEGWTILSLALTNKLNKVSVEVPLSKQNTYFKNSIY